MKRFRLKAVGLGLALATGTAVAADTDWRVPGQPPAPALVTPAGAPALLPPGVGAPPASATGDSGPIWLPARQPAPAPLLTPTGGARASTASIAPIPPTPAIPAPQLPQVADSLPVGPRGSGGFESLPAIPALPADSESIAAQPPAPFPAPAFAPMVVSQPDPPKAAEPPPMPPPRMPEFLPPWKGDPLPPPRMELPTGTPLPAPRPLDAPPPNAPQVELQPAPAALLIPAEVVEKHGTFGSMPMKPDNFGSMPIRLSRDYPPILDLFHIGHGHDDGTGASDPTDGNVPPLNRYFVQGEYLLWWVPGFATPVLATTNANTALNGYLGEPGTTSLLGPGGFLGSTRSGLRLRAGAWLDDCGTCGIDASFFFLGGQSANAAFNSSQYPLITRPVYVPNLVPGTNMPLGENGEAVAVPGILNGAFTARAYSELWGADVNLRKSLLNQCDARAEVFAGYRYLSLRESLTLTEDITVVGSGGTRLNITDPIGTHVVVQDRFATTNSFNGGQIGGLYERRFGRWQLDARGSLALGDTHQQLNIDGFQVRQQPGVAPMTFNGGLLAAGPNLGRFSSDRFSVVPEITLTGGYWVTPHLRLFAGYNFLYWTHVIRPGDQIDHTVDLTFVPNALPGATFSGLDRPRPLFKQSDLAINGIQFGIDWRW